MTARFTVEFKGDYVEVHSDGEKDIEYARHLWTEVEKTCRASDCHRVLGLAKTTKPVKVIEGFDHAELFKGLGITPDYRIAWVEFNEEAFEIAKFIETVIFNRSIAALKAFHDEAAARLWLFSKEGV